MNWFKVDLKNYLQTLGLPELWLIF